MFDPETINRLGLAAQFFSFWLVTPEVLSANTLRKLQTNIRKKLELTLIGPIGFAVVGFFIGLVASIVMERGLGAAAKLVLILTASGAVSGLILAAVAELLEASEAWKRRFAYSGAFLFVGGTAAQFAATYGGAP